MKKHFIFGFIALFLAVSFNGFAQVGIGTEYPHSSAQLEVQSTDKGVLLPRVSSTGNVSSPTDGLIVYQTGSPAGLYIYTGGSWSKLAQSSEVSAPSGGGSESIIPFASGLPAVATTVLGGIGGTTSLIGFGNSVSGISVNGGIIDLTGSAGTLLNFAFSVPKDGTITAMAGYFSTTAALSLVGSTITLKAQLFKSSTPNNTFTAVPNAEVTLAPALTGILALGTVSSGTNTNLNISVKAGDRLLWVVSAEVTAGIDIAATVAGYASGGLSISPKQPD